MTTFVDGNVTVAEARQEDLEEAIARTTGLSIPTIRSKLREANGHTKLCNLFRQWPERIDEIASWTANFALQGDVFNEISEITSLGPRVVKRRLEEAHGKTLVQNVFADEWPSSTENTDRARRIDGVEQNGRQPISNRGQAPKDIEDADVSAPARVAPDRVDDIESVSRSAMFRRYDLRRARKSQIRREPAPHQSEALAKLHDWYRSRPTPHAGGILALPTGGGKTFTTVRFLCQEPLSDGYKVLWLAHTHHLLEQRNPAPSLTFASFRQRPVTSP